MQNSTTIADNIIIEIDSLSYTSYTTGEDIENNLYKKDFKEMGETALCIPSIGYYLILNGNFIPQIEELINKLRESQANVLRRVMDFFHQHDLEFGSTHSTASNSPIQISCDAWLRARGFA